ncbi:MAG: amidase family protein [Mycoplasmatales bacterium]
MTKMNLTDFAKTTNVNELIETLKTNPGNSVVAVNEAITSTEKIIAIKDIHANTALKTTAASNVLESYQSPFDSHVVEKLAANNYQMICTTNMDEYAMGGMSIGSCYGPTDSALDSENLAGGSSSGSAYLVGAGVIPLATGTDTGGSVRQPAALNGVIGYKPTYGLISRYGTFSFASSFDTIGLIGTDLTDIANATNALAVQDNRDMTCFVPTDFDATKGLNESVTPKKIAYIKEWMETNIDTDLKAKINEQIEKFKAEGHTVEEVSIPTVKYSFELYTVLAYAEASSNLSRYDGIRFGDEALGENRQFIATRKLFGKEVKMRLLIGSYMLASENAAKYFTHSQKIRQKMKQQFDEVFAKYDLIVGPMTPNVIIAKDADLDSYESNLADLFAIPANLVGIPAISMPLGKNEKNQPFAIQVMANRYDDANLLAFAKTIKEF